MKKASTQKHLEKLIPSEVEIFISVSNRMKIGLDEIFQVSRKREIVNARKVLSMVFYSKEYTLKKIASIIRIKEMNHTSIINLLRKAKNHYKLEPKFAEIVDSFLYPSFPKLNALQVLSMK